LTDLIKSWSVALTKQLSAQSSRTSGFRLLICEDCSARQLAWAEPYRQLPSQFVVEPVA
jgi:hypothetical protein